MELKFKIKIKKNPKKLKKKEKLTTYEKVMLLISIMSTLAFWLNFLFSQFIN
jgi:cell division protein FtsL